jgi:hypothetical protein
VTEVLEDALNGCRLLWILDIDDAELARFDRDFRPYSGISEHRDDRFA